MQEETINTIITPTIDLSYYIKIIINFFINHFPQFLSRSESVFGYLIGLSIVVSFVLFLGIIFSVESLKSIRRRESLIYDANVEAGYETVKKAGDPELSNKWNRIITEIESDNEASWRQAIIEADTILADLLTRQGYKGDGIGEQLKRVVKGDFETIDQAWEAHKIRNMIAHSGADFILNQIEARRVINLYKKVFEEFYYI